MILWINGAFGAGKTQTAYELNRRIPQSYVFDPENAGYYLRESLPQEMAKNDFQDHPLWREINNSVLKYIVSGYSGIVIVPMTLTDPVYFEEIIGQLRQEGIKIHHFTLCATRETLLRRLESRGEAEDSWPARQIERCLKGFEQAIFQQYIDTEKMSVCEVAENIATELGIVLRP